MKWFKKQLNYKFSNKYFEILQKKWTDKMSNLTKNLSKKTLIFLLILFVSSSGLFFGFLLYRSFTMELSNRFEVIQISKTLPVGEDKIINRRSEDSSNTRMKIMKSDNKN